MALPRLPGARGGAGAGMHLIILGGREADFATPPPAVPTPYVFRLGAFLAERFHEPFVLDYIRRRGIGAVSLPPGGRYDAFDAAIRGAFGGMEIRREDG